MPKRSFLSSFFVFSGAALIALISGFVWSAGVRGTIEYLGPNRHLFGLIQASRGKAGILRDGDDRSSGTVELAKTRSTSVSYLISLLNNSDSEIRIDSLIVLGKLLDRGNYNSNIARETYDSTSSLDMELVMLNTDAFPHIIRLTNDPNQNVRLRAINTLGVVAENSRFENSKLDPLSLTRQIDLNSSAVLSIIQLLNDPDLQVRQKAISMLGALRVNSKITPPNLTQLLNDPDSSIRNAAINSISCIEGKKYCATPSNGWRSRG